MKMRTNSTMCRTQARQRLGIGGQLVEDEIETDRPLTPPRSFPKTLESFLSSSSGLLGFPSSSSLSSTASSVGTLQTYYLIYIYRTSSMAGRRIITSPWRNVVSVAREAEGRRERKERGSVKSMERKAWDGVGCMRGRGIESKGLLSRPRRGGN